MVVNKDSQFCGHINTDMYNMHPYSRLPKIKFSPQIKILQVKVLKYATIIYNKET